VGSGILTGDPYRQGGPVGATGLAADPKEYRSRLAEQEDAQLDAWAQELMRDMAIRRGVVRVVADFRKATKLSELEFERVFASGGGPPAMIGRDADGRLIVPAVTLYALVPGLRARVPDARDRVIEYLVENFHDFVYA
jgi:hypothetical protein